ncbi:hypothetical protein [Serratia rubidaea]|uniref:hypothetical protein n=1 Tax=Serratia rubidaea TaxID=61652 RepID=UPI0011DF9CCB|nr:hypothetical protein [Serratia rubidaea]
MEQTITLWNGINHTPFQDWFPNINTLIFRIYYAAGHEEFVTYIACLNVNYWKELPITNQKQKGMCRYAA